MEENQESGGDLSPVLKHNSTNQGKFEKRDLQTFQKIALERMKIFKEDEKPSIVKKKW